MIHEELLRDHELIEEELTELKTIMQFKMINYPNLIHVLKKIEYLLRIHQMKEKPFFMSLTQQGVRVPLLSVQGTLSIHFKALWKALRSGSDYNVRTALKKHIPKLIGEVHARLKKEEWALCTLPPMLWRQAEIKVSSVLTAARAAKTAQPFSPTLVQPFSTFATYSVHKFRS